MIKKTILIILVVLSASCTTLSDKTHLAALADTTTTVVALNSGHTELNTLIGQSSQNVVLAGILKYFLIEQLKNTDSKKSLRMLYGVYTGAAVNNVLVILNVSAPLPVVVGITTAIILYTKTED